MISCGAAVWGRCARRAREGLHVRGVVGCNVCRGDCTLRVCVSIVRERVF